MTHLRVHREPVPRRSRKRCACSSPRHTWACDWFDSGKVNVPDKGARRAAEVCRAADDQRAVLDCQCRTSTNRAGAASRPTPRGTDPRDSCGTPPSLAWRKAPEHAAWMNRGSRRLALARAAARRSVSTTFCSESSAGNGAPCRDAPTLAAGNTLGLRRGRGPGSTS